MSDPLTQQRVAGFSSLMDLITLPVRRLCDHLKGAQVVAAVCKDVIRLHMHHQAAAHTPLTATLARTAAHGGRAVTATRILPAVCRSSRRWCRCRRARQVRERCADRALSQHLPILKTSVQLPHFKQWLSSPNPALPCPRVLARSCCHRSQAVYRPALLSSSHGRGPASSLHVGPSSAAVNTAAAAAAALSRGQQLGAASAQRAACVRSCKPGCVAHIQPTAERPAATWPGAVAGGCAELDTHPRAARLVMLAFFPP